MITQEQCIDIIAEHLMIAVMTYRSKTEIAFNSNKGCLIGLRISPEEALKYSKDLLEAVINKELNKVNG